MDISSLMVHLIGTGLTLALVYYGLRTLKLFRGNVAGRAWTYISVSAVCFIVGVVMFLIDALAPMGLVAAEGYADRGSILSFSGTEEELSLLGEQRPLLLEFVDISSTGQIILYLEKANRKDVCRILEDIRRVESFSLE